MYATEVEMPSGIFNFSGWPKLGTYAVEIDEMRIYDDVMVDRTRLCSEAVRKLSMYKISLLAKINAL